jgi:hypothetical protein
MKATETAAARKWLRSDHVVTPADTNTIIEELLEAVFSKQSVPSMYI